MEIRYLTTDEVAVRYRTSPATVRYWRHIGVGPKSWKAGRRVLYDLADLEQWERSRQEVGAA